jgi:hypothetical protein
VTVQVDVVFLAVNYKTTPQSLELARRFDADPGLAPRAFLLLVDNSTERSAGELGDAIAASGSGATCISAGRNLGYFGGARFGLDYLVSRNIVFRWLVVSNVDLLFDPEAVVLGLSRVDSSRVGVVAPNIVSGLTGKVLNPYMRTRPSAFRMHAYKWIYRSYPTMLAYEWLSRVRSRWHAGAMPAGQVTRPPHGECGAVGSQGIYAGHGSMLAFSSEYFARGGNLHHAPFLFGEEISVAENVRRIGLEMIWHPGIDVEHAEHVSVGQLPSRQMHGFLKEATAFCANSYF